MRERERREEGREMGEEGDVSLRMISKKSNFNLDN